ncbi:hypothetical protein HMPREF0742_01457 [Rothia aeria F0184]|uniref:Uncharacterized protein n=1 Tax=Rothia aeria F0184 TaxID=888019 RepID=U7V301_9MICC|nr:hypothetical protein HMPREF0742_01457 [Rothia aeria F0184]
MRRYKGADGSARAPPATPVGRSAVQRADHTNHRREARDVPRAAL